MIVTMGETPVEIFAASAYRSYITFHAYFYLDRILNKYHV